MSNNWLVDDLKLFKFSIHSNGGETTTKRENIMASPQYGHINEELTEVTGSIDVQEEFKQMIELPVGCVITRICETATGIRISFRHFVKDKEDGTVEEAETEDAILYLIEEGSAVPKCLRGQNTVDVFTFAGKTMYAFLR